MTDSAEARFQMAIKLFYYTYKFHYTVGFPPLLNNTMEKHIVIHILYVIFVSETQKFKILGKVYPLAYGL